MVFKSSVSRAIRLTLSRHFKSLVSPVVTGQDSWRSRARNPMRFPTYSINRVTRPASKSVKEAALMTIVRLAQLGSLKRMKVPRKERLKIVVVGQMSTIRIIRRRCLVHPLIRRKWNLCQNRMFSSTVARATESSKVWSSSKFNQITSQLVRR